LTVPLARLRAALSSLASKAEAKGEIARALVVVLERLAPRSPSCRRALSMRLPNGRMAGSSCPSRVPAASVQQGSFELSDVRERYLMLH